MKASVEQRLWHLAMAWIRLLATRYSSASVLDAELDDHECSECDHADEVAEQVIEYLVGERSSPPEAPECPMSFAVQHARMSLYLRDLSVPELLGDELGHVRLNRHLQALEQHLSWLLSLERHHARRSWANVLDRVDNSGRDDDAPPPETTHEIGGGLRPVATDDDKGLTNERMAVLHPIKPLAESSGVPTGVESFNSLPCACGDEPSAPTPRQRFIASCFLKLVGLD